MGGNADTFMPIFSADTLDFLIFVTYIFLEEGIFSIFVIYIFLEEEIFLFFVTDIFLEEGKYFSW